MIAQPARPTGYFHCYDYSSMRLLLFLFALAKRQEETHQINLEGEKSPYCSGKEYRH